MGRYKSNRAKELSVELVNELKRDTQVYNLDIIEFFMSRAIAYGSKNNRSKKSSKPVKIEQYDMDGKYIDTYPSIKVASLATGVFSSAISRYINNPGVRRRKSKFIWKKVNFK